MYYCQDANIYEKVTSVISWNCPNTETSIHDMLVITTCCIRKFETTE